MCSSCLMYSCLFVYGKLQMFWLAIFILGLSEGSPYVGVVGGDAYLNWTITNTPQTGLREIRNADRNLTLIYFYPNAINPAVIFDKRITYTGNLSLDIVSFTLSNITQSDAGKYEFTQIYVDLGGQALVIAENPIITGITNSFASVVAGRDQKLNCSAESKSIPPGYNLTMFSEWKRNGGNIIPGFKHNVTGTILTIINVTRAESGDRYTCRAYEEQRKKSDDSGEFSLTVLYGPDNMHIIPSEVNLDEGNFLKITCFAECNPLCTSYQWQKETRFPPVGSSASYVVKEVNRTHAGVYICTVNNTAVPNSATAKTTVKVNYGPDSPLQLIPPKTLYRLEEKMQTSEINCFSDCFPSCNFQWTGPVSSSTGVIAIGTVERSKSGNYTCMGKNPRTQNQASSATVTFIVIYGPDTPVLTPSSIKYILNESNSLPVIRCSTDCFPGCTTYWYKEQTKLPGIEAGVLALGDVYRNDSGTYTCQSKNMESNATRDNSIQLVVQYRASITNFSAKDDNSLIKENDSLQLLCQVDSNPLSDIFLYNEDNVQLKKEESALKLNYTIRTAECLDAGNYRCRASNSIMNGNYASSNLQIMVACSPRLDYRKNVSTVYYTGLKSNVTLAVYVIAYPDPTNITWYHRENETSIWQRVNYQPTISGGLFSILIQLTSQKDFGYYMVTMENYLGNFSNTYNIMPESEPEVPQNFSVTETGPYSLTVEWAPGFGGGHPQHFIIEYAKHSDGDWHKSGEILDVGSPMQSSILSGLQQKTTYQLRMYAENDIGDSEKTQVITATTSGQSTYESPETSVAGIIGGISSGIVIILIAVIGIFLWRRYQHTIKNEHEKDAKMNHEERSPESDSYEQLHSYANNDIQMYSSLKIPEASKESQTDYENTWIKA